MDMSVTVEPVRGKGLDSSISVGALPKEVIPAMKGGKERLIRRIAGYQLRDVGHGDRGRF